MPEKKRQVRRKKTVAKSPGRKKASPRRSGLGYRIKKATPKAKKMLKRGAKVIEQGVQVIGERAGSLGNTLLKKIRS